MIDVHRTEIDGVPTFWAEAPGHLTGGLIFRVGQCDESLVTRGHTHLIEHLALAAMGQEHLAYNGSVEQTSTSFIAQGRPEEVRDFINGVVASLARLPFDRLEREVRILDTEASRSGGGLAKMLLAVRFGTAGHGLPAYRELGLFRAEPAVLDAWRRHHFCRGNVALWFSGEPPAGLDLSALADGARRAAPEPEPLQQELPAWYPSDGKLVAVSFLGARSSAWSLANGLMQKRLQTRLREEDGRSYEIGGTYEPLTADIAYVIHYADTLEDEAAAVRDAFITEANRFALHGPGDDEWTDVHVLAERARNDPYAAGRRATFEAHEWVCFASDRTQEQDREDLEAVTPDDVRAAWKANLPSAIWAAPRSVGVDDHRYVRIPDGSTWAAQGWEVARPPGTAERLAGDVLVVGDLGVTIRMGPSELLSVAYAECRAVEAWTDGARRLWAPDGVALFLHPAGWSNGAAVIADIDRRIETRLFVTKNDTSGYEHPWAPTPTPTPTPTTMTRPT